MVVGVMLTAIVIGLIVHFVSAVPNPKILNFVSTQTSEDHTVLLQWMTSGADEVTLNNSPVPPSGKMPVATPGAIYTLVAKNKNGPEFFATKTVDTKQIDTLPDVSKDSDSIRPPNGPPSKDAALPNLNGEWKADDKRKYYIRQIKDGVSWVAVSSDSEPIFMNLFRGKLLQKEGKWVVTGNWAESGNTLSSGSLTLKVVISPGGNIELGKPVAAVGFQARSWTRSSNTLGRIPLLKFNPEQNSTGYHSLYMTGYWNGPRGVHRCISIDVANVWCLASRQEEDGNNTLYLFHNSEDIHAGTVHGGWVRISSGSDVRSTGKLTLHRKNYKTLGRVEKWETIDTNEKPGGAWGERWERISSDPK